MYGAILGDIIGSPFEFDKGDKTKDFDLFSEKSKFTDDTVLTIAIAQSLLEINTNTTDKEIKKNIVKNMQLWGNKYPKAGYGLKFNRWLKSKYPRPYRSFGNGSAMRVSSAGWMYDSLLQTQKIAKLTAEVTHNHPEGIKGAVATASCIYLARIGTPKEIIKEYIEIKFRYKLNRTLDEIRSHYHYVESCQKTVPEAIIAFLESNDFEDAIRNAVSLGGDTDTLAAITGSIAEAYYGVPDELKEKCRNYLDESMIKIIDEFTQKII